MQATANPPYRLSDTLRTLIQDNRRMLIVASRFGISLRHVGHRIDELDRIAGVHPATFLCVANLVAGKPYDASDIDMPSLTGYLRRAHTYFLDYFLPDIRHKLIHALDFTREAELTVTVMRFFDDYMAEVREHMRSENVYLFGYIDSLLAGQRTPDYAIEIFAAHHDAVSDKLRCLKDVLIRYSPETDVDRLNSVLYDIIECEDDLNSHCRVEDLVLVPAVRALEEQLPPGGYSRRPAVHEEVPESDMRMSTREREIIACVAKGMSNKEIADKLCISVHTVTTHRRNISSKLGIHTTANLIVYAILNGIIGIDSLKD